MKTHWFVPLLFLVACADGGTDDRPRGDVTVANSTYHQFSFRSLRGFGAFPVSENVAFADRRVLNLFEDSTYSVTSSSGTSTPDSYALANDGTLSIYVTGYSGEPSVVFRGAYDRVGTDGSYFFTDRVSTPNGPSIGIYLGAEKVVGQVELEGAWHVMSLHTIFGQTVLDEANVGRATHGAVSISAGAAGTARTISGTGFQNTTQTTTSAVTFGGSIQNLLDGSNNGDGTCNLTVDYTIGAQAADARVMRCAANDNVIFGLDSDESDGEAGLLLMVRKFDTPLPVNHASSVLGTFLVGGHTLFINPSNSGSDAFVGVVTFGSGSAFRLDATGADGQDFSYTGTYSLTTDGGMSIAIAGTNETWFAAISRDYNTLVLVDDYQELRSNNTPELNLLFGVRRKED